MNSFIQLIVKFFLRLIGQKEAPKPTVQKPEPVPVTEPDPPVATPGTPEAAEDLTEPPAAPEPEEPAILTPEHGLAFEEEFEEKPDANGQTVKILKSVRTSDGSVAGTFRYFKKGRWEGFYSRGEHQVRDFIEAESAMLGKLDISPSSQGALRAVSENEGRLEAINAYDGAFLSFGMFQWTLGTKNNAGELPALVKKLKQNYPDTFQQYFGRFGLDVSEDTNSQSGYLVLNGELINSPELKEQFRSREWVYRFWRAGGDPQVQAISVKHAAGRLEYFYWRWKINGFTLNKIITSEYGVALLLDNHVNLPAHAKLALEAAMNETGLTDPTNWNSEEEQKVLAAYVQQRNKKVGRYGPMHDALGRSGRIAKYVERNILSDRRNSFSYTRTRSRGLDSGNFVPAPAGYDPNDFKDLEMDNEERDMTFLEQED